MKLITGTGKEFNFEWKGLAFTGNLVIAISGSTVPDVMAMALNPEDTKKLIFKPDETKEEIFEEKTGYTRFSQIMVNEGTNTIDLTLGREYAQ